jgi:hypothetical protein
MKFGLTLSLQAHHGFVAQFQYNYMYYNTKMNISTYSITLFSARKQFSFQKTRQRQAKLPSSLTLMTIQTRRRLLAELGEAGLDEDDLNCSHVFSSPTTTSLHIGCIYCPSEEKTRCQEEHFP